ncbi:hypothetical protein [Thomasclavelia cocleata]
MAIVVKHYESYITSLFTQRYRTTV